MLDLYKYYPREFKLDIHFMLHNMSYNTCVLRLRGKLTQPRARTNRYACSPIPYYVELINSQLP